MSKAKNALMTILIILGILVTYIHQMSPSPILSAIGEEYNVIGNDALLNLSISIIFLMMVVGSIAGGALEAKLGTSRLFVLTLALVTIGLAVNFFAFNYTVFLIGRVIYGLGFGLGVPFIGSAIMKWYPKEKREMMTTINALFPFFGTVICFVVMEPQYNLFERNTQMTFGVWGFLSVAILILWLVVIGNPGRVLSYDSEDNDESEQEEMPKENVYINLIKRKPIRLLAVIFICDFACYSYIATILPTFLFESGNMSETTANLWAAVAFPLAGIIGCGLGGIITNKTGLRKPTLMLGQLLKFVGIVIMVLCSDFSIVLSIIGAGLFGFGNGFWMPAFFGVPTELPKMNGSLVAAAFALMSSCGFIMGFITPTLGGIITNKLMEVAPIASTAHAFGLKWSLFIFGFLNVIGLVCAILIKETGSGAGGKQNAENK